MNIEILDLISEGTYGSIYSVKLNDKKYACKFMNIDNKHIPCDFISEINNLTRLNHPNIIKMDGYFFIDDKKCCIIMELGICDLYDFIMDPEQSYDVRMISFQILSALHHILNQGIITSDIKTENIIVFEDGHVELIDFGLSQLNIFNHRDTQWKFSDAYTITYRAPEILKNMDYDEKAEAWAFGNILYELENREKLFYVEDSDGSADDDRELQLDLIHKKNARS